MAFAASESITVARISEPRRSPNSDVTERNAAFASSEPSTPTRTVKPLPARPACATSGSPNGRCRRSPIASGMTSGPKIAPIAPHDHGSCPATHADRVHDAEQHPHHDDGDHDLRHGSSVRRRAAPPNPAGVTAVWAEGPSAGCRLALPHVRRTQHSWGMDLRGIRIGSVLGIPLRLDLSVIIIFAIIATSLATAALPELSEGYRPVEYWAVGIGAALLSSRRSSHTNSATPWSPAASKFPSATSRSGSSAGSRRSRAKHTRHRDELEIAVAGPAMSFGLAYRGIAAAGVASAAGASDLVISAFAWLGSINVLLGIFNLVPAAPLDGGRVLHTLLWKRHGDPAQVTAARAGRGFAWILVAGGIAEIWLLGSVGGVWLILMGWFLFTAAHAEETQAIVSRDLAGVTVTRRDDAESDHRARRRDDRNRVHDFVLQHRCSAFPIVEASGELIGLVTLNRLRQVAAARIARRPRSGTSPGRSPP